jgi:photosystem II stability/assembly factor-like uncharacterized protein
MTLILGTDDGVWRREDSASTRMALAGKRVIHVAASAGTVIAAVRREGVYRVDAEGADPLWEGDARSCAVAPDGTLYVGSEPAMVFRSTDDGDNWTRLDAIDTLPTRDTWTFPPPPHEPHVLSIDFPAGRSQDVLAGVEVGGVIRSQDGGDAWTELNSGVYEDVHSVRPDPSRPTWLFAITGAGFYASEDGGGSWERRMEGMERGYTIGLSVSPDRAGELLVTAGRRPPGVESGVYTSSDRGQSWDAAGGAGLPDSFDRAPVPLLTTDGAWLGADDGALYHAASVAGPWELLERLPASINAMTAGGSPSSVMH